VARGLYTEDDVRLLHTQMLGELLEFGGTIDDIRFCPYHPNGVVERYRRDSIFRKPGPGMILELLEKWGVESRRSLLIGDKESDLRAAEAAGVAGHLYYGGDLLEFVAPLISELKSREDVRIADLPH
jgi:D-glycero-D-manno-heptose 1,7-bisphosphate phosphatase